MSEVGHMSEERMMELLTPAEMGRADQMAIAGGTAGTVLMERAGRLVADRALAMTGPGDRIVIFCGPGNNGGDGLVAARHVRRSGRSVDVCLLAAPERYKGDAAWAFDRLSGGSAQVGAGDLPELLAGCALVVDALFGAGLDRPLKGLARDIVECVRGAGLPVLSVDLPSGVSGLTGEVLAEEKDSGQAFEATETVTFFRKKPGHLLYPGRALCGALTVGDIGIPASVLSEIAPMARENGPAVWASSWSPPRADGHKYTRGHAVIFGGPVRKAGASRLAAAACLRAGAGLVTLACPPSALMANACHLTAVMLESIADVEAAKDYMADERLNAVAIGPGFGVGEAACAYVHMLLDLGRGLVLDADALTSFQADPERLFAAIGPDAAERTVLTPHLGEFARLFPRLSELPRKDKAVEAASQSGAVVILKGADTVIAAPDGRCAINSNAPPFLATAGAGDVLAGIACGLLAQGMPAYEAACMAVWLHGAAAQQAGIGLTAEDLPGALKPVFAELVDNPSRQ